MDNNGTQRSPPSGPIQPQNPPPQTALGSNDDTGLPLALIQRPMPSLPFIYQDIISRKEYIPAYDFAVSSADGLNKLYTTFNVMSMISEDIGSDYKNSPTMRQILLRNSLNYLTSAHITFLAIKPPLTSGKLQISWTGSNLLMNNQANETNNNLQNMWVWDVGASPTFTIPINGHNLWDLRRVLRTNKVRTNYSVETDEFTSGLGYLSVRSYQQYQPGGIFPQQFTVKVFRSLPDLTIQNPYHFDNNLTFEN